jgi:hypothetical protein
LLKTSRASQAIEKPATFICSMRIEPTCFEPRISTSLPTATMPEHVAQIAGDGDFLDRVHDLRRSPPSSRPHRASSRRSRN